MARGFESKDVEFQQAEAVRPRAARRVLTADERETEAKRRSLELSLSKARAEREAATHPRHRSMLDQAIAALETQLRQLKSR
jgi:hypothetical protein